MLIVTGVADADFAEEVRKTTRGLDIEIAHALPAGEQRTVLLVWSAASPATAADVPTLIELRVQGRLVVTRRDDTPLLQGLGDLEIVPADAPARETAFKLLHATLAPGNVATIPKAMPAHVPMVTSLPPPPSARKSRAAAWIGAIAIVLLLAAGAGAFLG
ncbi:MAG: hypothetical protein A3D94_21250 [Alphaproteobacteria bacterium RIFCSPHIGHO2_12_FULL_66_14]|nr:MAG: hypothetical protein A3D94_21250 [Alphaproteobacteria bacterium RIFCSPHIGHO2_12_FULL_66_14]